MTAPLAVLLLLAAGASAVAASAALPAALQNHTDDPHYPIFHVRPDDGWHTNDPNGPFFFNGVFHLFSQCRKLAVRLPIPPGGWCHYASKDLVKWRRLGYPLRPDQPYDNISLNTGSATIVDGVPTMVYPGIGSVTDGSVNHTCPNFRVPALAGPCRMRIAVAQPKDLSDEWLTDWVKSPNNPVVDAPPADIDAFWQDFTQAWLGEDGRWWMLSGAGWRDADRSSSPVPMCSAPDNRSFTAKNGCSCKAGDELWIANTTTAGVVWPAHPGSGFSCPEFYGLPAPMPPTHRVFEGLGFPCDGDCYWLGKYDAASRRYDPSGYSYRMYNCE